MPPSSSPVSPDGGLILFQKNRSIIRFFKLKTHLKKFPIARAKIHLYFPYKVKALFTRPMGLSQKSRRDVPGKIPIPVLENGFALGNSLVSFPYLAWSVSPRGEEREGWLPPPLPTPTGFTILPRRPNLGIGNWILQMCRTHVHLRIPGGADFGFAQLDVRFQQWAHTA